VIWNLNSTLYWVCLYINQTATRPTDSPPRNHVFFESYRLLYQSNYFVKSSGITIQMRIQNELDSFFAGYCEVWYVGQILVYWNHSWNCLNLHPIFCFKVNLTKTCCYLFWVLKRNLNFLRFKSQKYRKTFKYCFKHLSLYHELIKKTWGYRKLLVSQNNVIYKRLFKRYPYLCYATGKRENWYILT
jgi:hypothetical protein